MIRPDLYVRINHFRQPEKATCIIITIFIPYAMYIHTSRDGDGWVEVLQKVSYWNRLGDETRCVAGVVYYCVRSARVTQQASRLPLGSNDDTFPPKARQLMRVNCRRKRRYSRGKRPNKDPSVLIDDDLIPEH